MAAPMAKELIRPVKTSIKNVAFATNISAPNRGIYRKVTCPLKSNKNSRTAPTGSFPKAACYACDFSHYCWPGKERKPGQLGLGTLVSCDQGHAPSTVLRAYAASAISDNQHCWQCGRNIHVQKEQFFCECGVIQAPNDHKTLFEIMDVEVKFDIDTTKLTQRFRNLQRSMHPDKFAQKSDIEKKFSEEQSSRVNTAYNTLLKPLPRGLYMLELFGHSIEESDIHVDPGFLMEVMEINEAISEVQTVKEIRKFAADNQRALNKIVRNITDAFDAKDMEKAKSYLAELRYYCNIEEKIKALETDFASN